MKWCQFIIPPGKEVFMKLAIRQELPGGKDVYAYTIGNFGYRLKRVDKKLSGKPP